MQVVQIILRYLDSGCSKLNLEEGMAPVRISSGPEPIMTLDLSSSSLVLYQMMFRQNNSSLVLHQIMFGQNSSSLVLHQMMFGKNSSSLVLHQMMFRQNDLSSSSLVLYLMMFGQNSSSLVLHQMMSAQISLGLAPQCLKMLDHSSSSLGLHYWKGKPSLGSTEVAKESYLPHLVDIRQNTNFVRKALNVTPADSAHPFESPPAGKTDITFTRRIVPSNWLMKMKFNWLINLIWMIMSTIYNKTTRKLPVVEVKGKGSATDRWIIASQDETTGPSVHPEDATSTKMVRETLSHADAEFGGNSEKINSETDTEILNVGSNSKQSHVALAGPNPEHMQDVTTNIPPTDKDLEILFQPMFDEYFEQSTDSEPVPTATVVNAPIVSTNTSVSTSIAQDAPSTSHSLSSLQVHPPVFPQGVAAGPTIEDTSITQADLHPSVNPVAGEPSSAQSTSGVERRLLLYFYVLWKASKSYN
ncbi:hypothetical protein Tco_1153844 [Tanacetum coccineum]